MITTLAKIKADLGIENTTYDERIQSVLDAVEKLVIQETNNKFFDTKLQYSSTGISFDSNGINDSNAEFVDTEYLNTGWYYVSNSLYNDGFWNVTTAANTLLTVGDMTTEDASQYVTINKCKFPRELQLLVADMISEIIMKDPEDNGKSQETLGSHSISWDNVRAYSARLQKRLNMFKKVF